jgi:FMN phosphatase YigB (HAD superfamily)
MNERLKVKCLAFDCFGTVFDMSSINRDEIKAYVEHVRKSDFSPFDFPASWFDLKSHDDAREGIQKLQSMGLLCVALSNGDANLIDEVSEKNGFGFDYVIDLAGRHHVYKPHIDAYRTIEKDLGYNPSDTLMVTANPTFGDLEGSAAIGMPSIVIRHGYPNTIIELAEHISKASAATTERNDKE